MRKHKMLMLATALSTTSCAGVPSTFVQSERQQYNSVSPYQKAYASEHPDQAERINDNLQSWNLSLTSAEKALNLPSPTTQP
jgi:hypothetical protein